MVGARHRWGWRTGTENYRDRKKRSGRANRGIENIFHAQQIFSHALSTTAPLNHKHCSLLQVLSSLQERRRPFIFVYDLPPTFTTRMLQYRVERGQW